MKIVAVIPARYSSSRFPGKPLADICGKPMIWWVYRQLSLVKGLDGIFVAADDHRVTDVCAELGINYIMTSEKHPTHLDRLAEVAARVEADFYININGDEPLMMPEYVEALLPNESIDPNDFYFANAMTKIKKPVEVNDVSRIKIATDNQGYGLYMARTPIPYPKASSDFDYTCYVKRYMTAFLDAKDKKNGKYEKVAKVFEDIYWLNPNLIEHIELNLRS